MMSLVWMKLLFMGLFIIEGVMFGLIPLWVLNRIDRDRREFLVGVSNAFAGGIFISSGFIHLLGDSVESISKIIDIDYPFGVFFCACGFLISFFLEKVVFDHGHSHGHEDDLNLDHHHHIETNHHHHAHEQDHHHAQDPQDHHHHQQPQGLERQTAPDKRRDPSEEESQGKSDKTPLLSASGSYPLKELTRGGGGGRNFGSVNEATKSSGSLDSQSFCVSDEAYPDCEVMKKCTEDHAKASSMRYISYQRDLDLHSECEPPVSCPVMIPVSVEKRPLSYLSASVEARTSGDLQEVEVVLLKKKPADWKKFVILIVLSLHSIISGFALGLQVDTNELLPLGIAIISHKWVESFAVGTSLFRMEAPFLFVCGAIVAYSMVEPFGAAVGMVLIAVLPENIADIVDPVCSAFAAGTFIYVAAIDIMVEEFERPRHKYVKMFACIVGFLLMSSLALLETLGGPDDD
eukprot:TRINITY_DN3592_c0_g1_i1.p1 TRINITY_DN3592_c0_g1~~TRINITY_DN3592_c0_g1_i1.p1  ORF type:complete len:461 (+),score=167.72 TRINITY_DN3592_c0_g1_i1:93-1475(+)